MTDEIVHIYTDGACHPNPGPGGWGALLLHDGRETELYGGDVGPTTNNRMELTAPIEALRSLPGRSTVHIHTDSTYVRDGITKWIVRWRNDYWRTRDRKSAVKNAELWRALDAAVREHDVTWFWVKGHAGNDGNERADRLAALGMAEELARPVGERRAVAYEDFEAVEGGLF
ncbi:ribonuclease HI [Phytomonospora sp. NPDC050363]|uniref:ribonuclease HI n=1 Tax=Phytomonospora sp. NPDC050363 TaxID=3155642 RepID=UPI0033F690F1